MNNLKGGLCLSAVILHCLSWLAANAYRLPSLRPAGLLEHGRQTHVLCRTVAYLAKESRLSSSTVNITLASTDDVDALRREAAKLREEASEIRREIEEKKAQKIQRETERIDQLIDEVLIAVKVDNQTQMLHTEEQVMLLMQEKRLSADHVNKIFDRICELSPNRRQSIDNCSPLISLLLDAACMLDCMERSENPNKRWNHRVERDLRKKLFALGWGINIDDVRRDEREGPRAITGEKDLT